MSNLRKAAQQALEFVTSKIWGTTPYMDGCVYEDAARLRDALRAALKKADEDRAWVEERKANWAEDKALAKRNALEEADRIRKAGEEGRCWACGQKAEPVQEPVLLQCTTCGTVYAEGVPPQVPVRGPVAYMHKETGLLRREIGRPKGADWDANYWEPLYTAPPQQQAEPVGLIESLKDVQPCCGEYATCWRACTPRGKFLGQQESQRNTEQEPVVDCPRCGHCCPQRKPLTDEEIKAIHDTYYRRMGPMEFARAIEQAHGIGEKK